MLLKSVIKYLKLNIYIYIVPAMVLVGGVRDTSCLGLTVLGRKVMEQMTTDVMCQEVVKEVWKTRWLGRGLRESG